MKTSITHVAMDTHKKQHQVAWIHPATGEIQEFTVANTTPEIEPMVEEIRKQAAGEIHVCYEAGSAAWCCSGCWRSKAVSAKGSRRRWCRPSRRIGSRQTGGTRRSTRDCSPVDS